MPDRELKSGLAEVIKYGCVWDPLLFDWLDRNIAKLLARDAEALNYAIGRSCEIKATWSRGTNANANLRAILNFGHTFGHAIEAATAYEKYLHGEAVGLGMLIAADLSLRLGLIDAPLKERVRDILARTGLPTEAPRIGAAKALELMQMDKKVLAGAVRLVLLEKLGRAIVTDRVLAKPRSMPRSRSISNERPGALRRARGAFARPPLPGTAARNTDRNISAIAIASCIRPRSADWSTRPRCSSITRAICTGPG